MLNRRNNLFSGFIKCKCCNCLFKHAVVTPILKKNGLPPSMDNFRPVSTLPFISKLCERVMSQQLVRFFNSHNLLPTFQSAYRAGHSTETALVRIASDLLCTVDGGNASGLITLDLSAAFDTVDCDIMHSRLSTLGICDNALRLLDSYLNGRSQCVKIGDSQSPARDIVQGVAQ